MSGRLSRKRKHQGAGTSQDNNLDITDDFCSPPLFRAPKRHKQSVNKSADNSKADNKVLSTSNTDKENVGDNTASKILDIIFLEDSDCEDSENLLLVKNTKKLTEPPIRQSKRLLLGQPQENKELCKKKTSQLSSTCSSSNKIESQYFQSTASTSADPITSEASLLELEKSICNEDEKLCPSCKHIVSVNNFHSHVKQCLSQFKYNSDVINGKKQDSTVSSDIPTPSATCNELSQSSTVNAGEHENPFKSSTSKSNERNLQSTEQSCAHDILMGRNTIPDTNPVQYLQSLNSSCIVRLKKSNQPAPVLGLKGTFVYPSAPIAKRKSRRKKPVTELLSITKKGRDSKVAATFAEVLVKNSERQSTWADGERVERNSSRLRGYQDNSLGYPLWELTTAQRKEVREYYVSELDPHITAPSEHLDLNITFHRHLSQIPGRLNITQGYDSDDEECFSKTFALDPAASGALSQTQYVLAQLLSSQASILDLTAAKPQLLTDKDCSGDDVQHAINAEEKLVAEVDQSVQAKPSSSEDQDLFSKGDSFLTTESPVLKSSSTVIHHEIKDPKDDPVTDDAISACKDLVNSNNSALSENNQITYFEKSIPKDGAESVNLNVLKEDDSACPTVFPVDSHVELNGDALANPPTCYSKEIGSLKDKQDVSYEVSSNKTVPFNDICNKINTTKDALGADEASEQLSVNHSLEKVITKPLASCNDHGKDNPTTIPPSDISSNETELLCCDDWKTSGNSYLATPNAPTKVSQTCLSVNNLRKFNSLQENEIGAAHSQKSSEFLLQKFLSCIEEPQPESTLKAQDENIHINHPNTSSKSNVLSSDKLIKKLIYDWSGVLASELGSDVKIITHDGSIKVNSFVMMVRCKKLFEKIQDEKRSRKYLKLSKSGESEGSCIELVWSCSFKAAYLFIQYLYCGQCDVNQEDIDILKGTLSVAKEYDCADLSEYLEKCLNARASLKNVLDVCMKDSDHTNNETTQNSNKHSPSPAGVDEDHRCSGTSSLKGIVPLNFSNINQTHKLEGNGTPRSVADNQLIDGSSRRSLSPDIFDNEGTSISSTHNNQNHYSPGANIEGNSLSNDVTLPLLLGDDYDDAATEIIKDGPDLIDISQSDSGEASPTSKKSVCNATSDKSRDTPIEIVYNAPMNKSAVYNKTTDDESYNIGQINEVWQGFDDLGENCALTLDELPNIDVNLSSDLPVTDRAEENESSAFNTEAISTVDEDIAIINSDSADVEKNKNIVNSHHQSISKESIGIESAIQTNNSNVANADKETSKKQMSSHFLSESSLLNLQEELAEDWNLSSINNASEGKKTPTVGLHQRIQQLKGCQRTPSVGSTSPTSSFVVTPCPNYNSMPSPELKLALEKYGIRPMSRNKARKLLQHIYEQTHPVASDCSTLTTPSPTNKKSVPGRSRAVVNTSTPVGSSRAGRRRGDTASNSPQLPTVRFSEDSRTGCAEESLLLATDDQPSDSSNVHHKLREVITSDRSLHRAVLLYQPIWLNQFKDKVKSAGIKCSAATIVQFLDEQGITFRMGNGASQPRTKHSRKKR